MKSSEILLASITIVQVKARRLNMPLMGQAFFSAKLMERFAPCSIYSVALCLQDDPVLRPLLEAHPGLEHAVDHAHIQILCGACYDEAMALNGF